jgi:hemerythrin
VESVNEVTQAAAASSEQMSAATSHLSTMAQELQRLVAQFKIELIQAEGGDGNGKSTPALEAPAARPASPSALPARSARALPGLLGATTRKRGDYFTWTNELSVNVGEIDVQHRKLVDMINALHRALMESRGQQEQVAVIQGMVDYAATHFKLEEEYMRRFHYEKAESHIREHEAFSAKARDLGERARSSGFILTLEVLDFLKTWLKRHIMGVDRQYMACFSKNGLV